MVLYTKTKLSTPLVSISRSGKVVSLEKWKTDWFHEISELFHVTTDQVTIQNTVCKPTFEKVRAIESKARLNTVLSLIERYIRGQLLVTSPGVVRACNTNVNNSNNYYSGNNSSPLDESQTGDVMPWTMVDPNEVCPLDSGQQQLRKQDLIKSSYDLNEAVELLSSDGGMDDAESSSDPESCESAASAAPSGDEKEMPSRPKVLLMVDDSEKLSRKRKRSLMDNDSVAEKKQPPKTSGKLTHLLIPVSRCHLPKDSKLSSARLGLTRALQGKGQTLPSANVLLKKIEVSASTLQKHKAAQQKVKRESEEKSIPAVEVDEELGVSNLRGDFQGNDTCLTEEPEICDDVFSFLENEDSPLTAADLQMTSAELQMQSFASLFAHNRPADKLSEIQNKLETSNSHQLHIAAPPKQKRKYTKHQKKAEGAENQSGIENEFPKPPLPYNQLIYLAFKHNDFCQMTVRMIYKFIRTWFPYYEHAHQTWQNAVRHQLCCCKDYEKITLSPDSAADKGGKCAWKIRDQVAVKKLDDEMLAHLDKNDVISGIRNGMADCEMFDSLLGEIIGRQKNRKTLEQRIDEVMAEM